MDRTQGLACLTLACLLFAGCSGGAHRLVIGSKNFTEQVVLGEIIAQQVERRLGAGVSRRFNLGGTLLAHESLKAGSIDLYPEYTGTALMAVLRQPPIADPARTLQIVRDSYRPYHLEWLAPLGFNNSFALVIPGELARREKIETLSDAAKLPDWRLGVGYEFLTREDGFATLMSSYQLQQKSQPRSMDLGLLYQALAQGQVNMIAANTTDGMLARIDAKVLEDDRRVFPPYQGCVVVRSAALAAFPNMRAALEELSGKLSAETMRQLNYAADVEHKPIPEIAEAFLKEHVR
jgi:glycine betaine/choline ABC-type transport system substrate-binding protein